MESCDRNIEIIVCGRASLIHRSDYEAAFMDEGKHLMLWNEDMKSNIWIDKYDVRSHLTKSELERPNVLLAEDVIDAIDIAARKLEKDLDYERYRDMENGLLVDGHAMAGSSTGSVANQMKALDFKGNNFTDFLEKSEENSTQTVTIPFNVPEGITVPKTKKHLDIMMHTALKTRKSPQLEIFLKVKESNNHVFDFLNAGSSCYDFYKHLKDLPEDQFWKCFLRTDSTDQVKAGGKKGALSLLDAYSDPASDNDSAASNSDKPKIIVHCADSIAQSLTDCAFPKNDFCSADLGSSTSRTHVIKEVVELITDEFMDDESLPVDVDNGAELVRVERNSLQHEARKAERLQRAKLLAGHFLAIEEGLKAESREAQKSEDAMADMKALDEVSAKEPPGRLPRSDSEEENDSYRMRSERSVSSNLKRSRSRHNEQRHAHSSRTGDEDESNWSEHSRKRDSRGRRTQHHERRSNNTKYHRRDSSCSSSDDDSRIQYRRMKRRHQSRSRDRSPAEYRPSSSNASRGISCSSARSTLQEKIAQALAKEHAIFL